MDKLNYGNFDVTNSDIAFSSTNGYDEPQSELERRKQLSYPLKEVKDYINSTMPTDSGNNPVQLVVTSNSIGYRTTAGGVLTPISNGIPSGGTTGQVLSKKSNTDYDLEWSSSSAFSFVGMVVSATNLNTLAKVRNIYGASTTWTLISSVMLKTASVYGNGKALALTDGTNKGVMTNEQGSNVGLYPNKQTATANVGDNKTYESGNFFNSTKAVGVQTKTDLGTLTNSGLIADTITVYSWERTA